MKKTLSFILTSVLFFCSALVFGEQNDQKIWSVESSVYKYISQLYVSQGHALPFATGPWSTDELRVMVDRFDPESLDETGLLLYEECHRYLDEETRFSTGDGLKFSLRGIISPETYIHTNSTDFVGENDWDYDFEKRRALATLNAEFFVSNNIFIGADLDMGYDACIYENREGMVVVKPNYLYGSGFMTNIPYVPNTDMSWINCHLPARSAISFGGNHWSLSAGRDVVRWGHGETGNLFLGGNAIYDNVIRFTTYYDSLKYSTVTIYYPHEDDVLYSQYDGTKVHGIKLFLAHRIDVRLFDDKLNLALMEGMMYQNYENLYDMRFGFPLSYYHNYFIRNYSNSIVGLDVYYTPVNNLGLYGEMVLDEFAVSTESKPSSPEGGRLNKFGWLFGANYLYNCPLGLLTFNAEGVYADPNLYLREEYDASNKVQGLSMYGTIRLFSQGTRVDYIRNCVGYRYGGDCIVGSVSCTLDSLKNYLAKAEFFYMAHGIMYNPVKNDWVAGTVPTTPSTHDPSVDATNPDGVAEHLFRFSLSGQYKFSENLCIDAGADNWIILNKDNVSRGPVYDLQLHLGVTYSL